MLPEQNQALKSYEFTSLAKINEEPDANHSGKEMANQSSEATKEKPEKDTKEEDKPRDLAPNDVVKKERTHKELLETAKALHRLTFFGFYEGKLPLKKGADGTESTESSAYNDSYQDENGQQVEAEADAGRQSKRRKLDDEGKADA